MATDERTMMRVIQYQEHSHEHAHLYLRLVWEAMAFPTVASRFHYALVAAQTQITALK